MFVFFALLSEHARASVELVLSLSQLGVIVPDLSLDLVHLLVELLKVLSFLLNLVVELVDLLLVLLLQTVASDVSMTEVVAQALDGVCRQSIFILANSVLRRNGSS